MKAGKEPELRDYLEQAVANLDAAIKAGGVKHEVLNARQHEREAHIVAQAGVPGAVTIATNMAGRGTDIQLGGNAEMRIARNWRHAGRRGARSPRPKSRPISQRLKKQALDAGGLYVLATERHESRRIDNQLRGRSGRQGDPGRSKFFLSLQDDLMRIFGSDRMDGMLQKLGLKEGRGDHPSVDQQGAGKGAEEGRGAQLRHPQEPAEIRRRDERPAQGRVRAAQGTDGRHRPVGHGGRNASRGHRGHRAAHIPEKAYADQWDVKGLKQATVAIAQYRRADRGMGGRGRHCRGRHRRAADRGGRQGRGGARRAVRPGNHDYVEKSVLLQTLDTLWREHLVNLDHLRSVIGFRGYAQRDPLQEYKQESFELFQSMLGNLRRR
jgi:preprotein translocase subunit SecA